MIVNLINHSKAEGVLQRAFQSLSKEAGIKEVHYEAFDFHKECSKLQWGNLKHLIARLSTFLERFGYFHKSSLEQPIPSTTATFPNIVTQSGVFRTNCMDCLDRTNVVQSMLANENLNRVLFKFGVLKDGIETTESHPEFQRLFRGIWADHANLLAMQYAGSGALKTDFTRTGKRTYAGLLEDLRNALMRFFKNNFQDGFRQDSIDLFLGTTKVPMDGVGIGDYTSNLETSQTWIYYLPLILMANLSILLLTYLLSPSLIGPDVEIDTLLFVVFLTALATFTISVIRRKSRAYLDKPKFS